MRVGLKPDEVRVAPEWVRVGTVGVRPALDRMRVALTGEVARIGPDRPSRTRWADVVVEAAVAVDAVVVDLVVVVVVVCAWEVRLPTTRFRR